MICFQYRRSTQFILLLGLSLLFSCKQNSSFTADETIAVQVGVQKLASQTAQDISAKGPIAWLDYFEDSPDFFMASDGSIAFTNYKAADQFIKTTLVKQLRRINLKWSNIRIDLLTAKVATMGADFHEDLTDASSKTSPLNGYFTATVHQTNKGWKYRNVHWSIKKPN